MSKIATEFLSGVDIRTPKKMKRTSMKMQKTLNYMNVGFESRSILPRTGHFCTFHLSTTLNTKLTMPILRIVHGVCVCMRKIRLRVSVWG